MINEVLAQKLTIDNKEITGPLRGINNLGDIVNKAIPVVIGVASIILFLVIVWGGYNLLTSQGEPEKIKNAKAKITTAIIGFVLLIVSYFLVRLLSSIFGLGGGIF